MNEFQDIMTKAGNERGNIYRAMMQDTVRFRRLVELLGDNIYSLADDTTLRPGDAGTIWLVKEILKEMTGEGDDKEQRPDDLWKYAKNMEGQLQGMIARESDFAVKLYDAQKKRLERMKKIEKHLGL